MLFVSVDDFLEQARAAGRLSREQEKELARRMATGDGVAREALVRGYLWMAAAYVQRAPGEIRTLRTVYACVAMVEKCVDRFNFQQDAETFVHHLGWGLRQCITRCIVERA